LLSAALPAGFGFAADLVFMPTRCRAWPSDAGSAGENGLFSPENRAFHPEREIVDTSTGRE